MAAWNRKTILTNAIADWQQRGLLETETSAKLLDDVKNAPSGFAFRNILVLLAVICLGFAAMTFVAANWEDMSRLTRVVLIFAAMWAFWGGSVFLQLRDRNWFAQVFTLGACAMFGAGIMLISQIYHIQGSPKDATWLWAVGTLAAAALTRSIPALSLTIALLTIWVFIEPNMFGRATHLQLDFPLYMLVCSGLAYWMQSRFAAHLIVLSSSVWAFTTAISFIEDETLTFFASLITATFVLISGALFSDRKAQYLRGFERPLLFYLLGLIGALVCVLYFFNHEYANRPEVFNLAKQVSIPATLAVLVTGALAVLAKNQAHPNLYDIMVTAIFSAITFGLFLFAAGTPFVVEALMLAGSIWIIRMGWRIEYRPIAVLGFICFGLAMLLIYFETVGSLLGTSVFYLVAGIMLLLGVFLIPRLTKNAGETS